MRPDDVTPVEATILGKSVRLYFLKPDDEWRYRENGSFAAAINESLEEAIRLGKTVFVLEPKISIGPMSILRTVATDARDEQLIRKAIAEYRSSIDGPNDTTALSEKDCQTCDDSDCQTWQMLHGDGAVDGFPEESDPDILGAPSWEAIKNN